MPKKRHTQLKPLHAGDDFGDLVPDPGPGKRGRHRRKVVVPDSLPETLDIGKPTPVYRTKSGSHGKYEGA